MIAYFEVSVGYFVGMKELQSSQTLFCHWLYLTQGKALPIVELHELMQTFSQRLKNKAHVLSIFSSMFEVFFQLNDSIHSSSFLHNIRQDYKLNFCTFIILFLSSDNFDCIVFVFDGIEAFESPPKCTITKVSIDLNHIIGNKLTL